MCDVKEKKINRKKTHKEERRDLSLSLFLASFFTTRLSRLFSELFGFVCSKHSIKVYISYHLHDDAEDARQRGESRVNNKEREKRERREISSSLSLFVNPKSNPLTFCALDGSLTAANPGVPFK